MRPPGHDSLSNLLRRGDPAEGIADMPPDTNRRAALLARCAEEMDAERPVSTVREQGGRPGPQVFGGVLVMASLLLLGLFLRPPQRVVDSEGKPARATPATPRPGPSPAVAVKDVKRTKKSGVQTVTSSVRAAVGELVVKKPVLSLPSPEPRTEQKRRMRRYLASRRTAPSRSERRRPPRLVLGGAEKRSAPVLAPRPIPEPASEPVVERIIVIGDDTPIPPKPSVETIAIILSDKAQVTVTSRPDSSDTNL